MLTSLQKTKLDRRFTLLDIDGSGFLVENDYRELAQRLIKGANATGDKAQAVTDSMLGLWATIRGSYDRNADGRVSRDEWIKSISRQVLELGSFDQVIAPVAQAVLGAYDADGSGSLSRAEYRAMVTAMSVSDEDADYGFARLDLDGSGTLTIEELISAVRDFYTSADPQAPGNWLYGRI